MGLSEEALRSILMSKRAAFNLKQRKQALFNSFPRFGETDKRYIKGSNNITIFDHTVQVVQHSPMDFEVRLAALFHDAAKPQCYYGDDAYKSHGVESGILFEGYAKNIGLAEPTIKNIKNLIIYHDATIPEWNSALGDCLTMISRNFSYNLINNLYYLREADLYGKGLSPEEITSRKKKLSLEKELIISTKKAIDLEREKK